MKIEETLLDGALLLRPRPAFDERGFFTRTFDATIFDEWMVSHGLPTRAAHFIQDSQSRSSRGVIRGLHGRSGQGEAKLVRCARGTVFDVVVDARANSPTFGTPLTVTLDDAEFLHLFIPPGFLHGFQCLTPHADVCYRINRPHDPVDDVGVAYNDPELAIPWPLPPTVMSTRDAQARSWAWLRETLGLH